MLQTLQSSIEKKRKDDSGFTLIELLVVIIIIGILAAIVVVAVRGSTGDAKAKACSTNATNLLNAIENYTATGVTGGTANALATADVTTGLPTIVNGLTNGKTNAGIASADIKGVFSVELLAQTLVPDFIRSIPSQDATNGDGVIAVQYDIPNGKPGVIGVLCQISGGKNAGI